MVSVKCDVCRSANFAPVVTSEGTPGHVVSVARSRPPHASFLVPHVYRAPDCQPHGLGEAVVRTAQRGTAMYRRCVLQAGVIGVSL